MAVNIFTATWGLIVRSTIVVLELIPFLLWVTWLTIKDFGYTFAAFVLPNRPIGFVIPAGREGHAGLWPEYIPPGPKDSRGPCPGLNTLANHGLLPRNGKKLAYRQMSQAIQKAYNLSPSLGDQLTAAAYLIDQGRGWINLHDLNALNVIQHDASFTRPDIAFEPNQSHPNAETVEYFLSHSTDGKTLTLEDMAYFSGLRRAECRAINGQFSLTYSFFHKYFGSGNCALLHAIFGGDVEDLRWFLGQERLPDGWEPRVRSRLGHTIFFAATTTLEVEFNINENQKLREGDFIPERKGDIENDAGVYYVL